MHYIQYFVNNSILKHFNGNFVSFTQVVLYTTITSINDLLQCSLVGFVTPVFCTFHQ